MLTSFSTIAQSRNRGVNTIRSSTMFRRSLPDPTDTSAMQVALPERVSHIRGPAARGLVALGTPGGSVLLVDPRAGHRVEHELAAHSAGLADLDARADLLATCGYGTRQGQIVSDPFVKAGRPLGFQGRVRKG